MSKSTPKSSDSDDALLEAVRRNLPSAKSDEPVLIAFSGGLDSSVLVDLFDRAHQRGGPQPELIHVDHGARPDSHRDAAFCENIARERGLPLHIEELHLSIANQQSYRSRRLAAFARYALRRGITRIYLGHHADDRVESFLLNLTRGAGIAGLTTMSSESPFPFGDQELRLLRPLLDFRRADLETYAARRKIKWQTDPTNLTDAYSRNHIRHHIVPELDHIQGGVTSMLRSITNLESERRSLNHQANELANNARISSPGIGAHTFDRNLLRQAPPAAVAHLFLNLERSLDQNSLQKIQSAIHHSQRSTHRLTLSGCLITITDERVVFEPSHERGAKDILSREVHPIQVLPFKCGRAPFFGSQLSWCRLDDHERPHSDELLPHSPWTADFDLDALTTPLHIGGPIPGARLPRRKNNEIYHQKLTTLFSDHSIDSDLRWRWPVLYNSHGNPLWAVGLPRGVAALPDVSSPALWRLKILPSDDLIKILHQ